MIDQEAYDAALRSNLQRYKTGAAIYDRHGYLLSIGWSHSQHRERVHISTPWSVHAERHAIERLAPKERLRAHTVCVVTIATKSGRVVVGKPCSHCADRLSKLPNLQYVVFSQRIDS